jgi:hypothetical protein
MSAAGSSRFVEGREEGVVVVGGGGEEVVMEGEGDLRRGGWMGERDRRRLLATADRREGMGFGRDEEETEVMVLSCLIEGAGDVLCKRRWARLGLCTASGGRRRGSRHV